MKKDIVHDSSIFNIKTPEFFINMKKGDIPKRTDKDREAFVVNELNKCIKGVTINGIFIPGSLYYDLNYHFIELDTPDGRGVGRPRLRDNGWIIHNDYYQAQQQKKHYCVAGSRQIAKSDTLTSLTMREIMIFDNVTALLLFTNSQDKATFSGKMKVAYDNLEDFIKVPLLDKDFKKDFLRFGFKETTNDDELHARLYLYNTDGGHNAEIGAGKSINFFAYDEIGKAAFKESWDAVLPAFSGTYGIRNSAFFAFTGGMVEKSQNAEKFFMNPDSNNLLNINGTGRFMPGEYRADFKQTIPFVDYLKIQGKEVKPGSELDLLTIDYSDVEKASKILEDEAEKLLKSGETESYNKHKIYYPRKVSDMFLKENANPFSHLSSELEKLYEYLNTQSYESQTFKLEEMGSQVVPIPLEYHYDPFSQNLDQPIVIIDKPRNLGMGKLYVAGFDPFNTNKTSTSPSRASFYIMRKSTTDYTDPYQETMVAWYNGRKDIHDCRDKIRLLLKYYGAEQGSITLLHEAADDTLTQWFMDKRIGYWLEDTYQLAKKIFTATTAFAAKGLRPTTRNQAYYIGKILEYLEEELPDGRKGLWRLKDKLLVKQLLSFDGNLGDHDTLVGFGHAITHLYKEKNYTVRVNSESEKVSQSKIVESFKNIFRINNKKEFKRSLI